MPFSTKIWSILVFSWLDWSPWTCLNWSNLLCSGRKVRWGLVLSILVWYVLAFCGISSIIKRFGLVSDMNSMFNWCFYCWLTNSNVKHSQILSCCMNSINKRYVDFVCVCATYIYMCVLNDCLCFEDWPVFIDCLVLGRRLICCVNPLSILFQIDNGVVEHRWRGGGWMDGNDIRMDGLRRLIMVL